MSRLKGSKKGVSEIVSFLFILLLITVGSGSAYIISKTYIRDQVILHDRDNMENFITQFSLQFSTIKNHDRTTVSLPIYFREGLLEFNSTQVSYTSLVDLTLTEGYCINDICYETRGTSEKIYYNLTDSFTFNQNLTLEAGSYFLILTTDINASTINVTFR